MIIILIMIMIIKKKPGSTVIVETLARMVTDVNDEHEPKAVEPMYVTEDGIVIVVRAEQP